MTCLQPIAAAVAGVVRADAIAPPEAAVAAVKDYLRIAGDAENALIARLVAVAIGHGEDFMGSALIARPMRQWLACANSAWQRIVRAPVVSIDAVEAVANDGSATALPIEAYAIDIDAAGDGWVRVLDAGAATRLRVRFTAGLASAWDELPEGVAQGVIRMAGHFFTHRDKPDETALPPAMAALWWPWRRIRL